MTRPSLKHLSAALLAALAISLLPAPLFAEEEAAIDMTGIKGNHSHQFDFEVERYMGNIAYIAVLNSMVLRVPSWFKKLYAPIFMDAEATLNRLLPAGLACYALARWRKK